MAAVAAYLGDVLIGSVPTMIAAKFLISAYRAITAFMPASVVIRHLISPSFVLNFAPLQVGSAVADGPNIEP